MQIAQPDNASDHLTLTRWLAGVLLRWRLVAGITLATIVIGLLATFIIPPVYRSHTRNPDSWSEFRTALKTTRAELRSTVGFSSRNRIPSLAPTETYPTVHPASPQSAQPARADEPAAMARRPVA